ncbi:MAG: DEAD/DEAH box helicase [Alphaproteobacteria bacterium]
MSFEDIGLSEELLRAISDSGYTKPTPIQEQAIPYVLMNRDVLGCAQTGTGKTASFTLPMLDILANGRARARMPRSLILEPTRELAAQVAENFDKYGKYQKLNKALLIGGVSFDDQERLLDRGVDVLIATPGRLLDHFERGKVLLSDVKILVIDEADRMLDMGFIPDVERICTLIPRIRQTLMFSATMPPEIRRLAEKFLMNPKEVTVAPPATAAATVEQRLVTVQPDEKRAALRALLRGEEVQNALVFCNRKRDVDVVQRSLKSHGFDAGALHGDMDQFRRTDTLERFKNGEVRLLVCSDVAARGLDIAAVSHVFNFDVPIHADDYIHRIGRTGRAGRSGKAFTLAAPEDGKFVSAIQKLTGQTIEPLVLEGFEAAALEEGDGRRRGRGKKRNEAPARPAKDAEKARPEKRAKRREDAPEKPVAASEPRAERPRQPEPIRAYASKSMPPASKPAAAPTRAKSKPQQDEAKRPFRDSGEVPAFLLRRAPIDSAA